MEWLQDQEFDKLDKKVDFKVWKRLISYAMRYKSIAFKLAVVLIAVALVDLAYPLMTRYAIDKFIGLRTTHNLGLFAGVYAILVVLQAFFVYLFASTAGKLEMNIAYDIRQQAFIHLQELSFSFYDGTTVGYLMARMVSDISRLSEMIAWGLVDILWALAFAIGAMAVMITLNWKLALLALAVVPPLAVISAVFQKKILKYQRRVRRINSRITSAFNEGIMGAMTTKTLVREAQNAQEFTGITKEMRHEATHSAILSSLLMPIVMFLGTVGTALALYRGSEQVIAAALSYGTLAAFISYTTQMFEPIQQLARILAEMQSAQASAERVLSLIDTPCEITDPPEIEAQYGDSFKPKRENWPDIKGEIEFKNVTFSYKSGETVLKDFNIHVKPGETIALVGETGSGKSTIVNLACRFYEPTQGVILVDGADYKTRSQLWLQANLGYVLQSPHLFSGTIRDNIKYGKKDATDEEVRRAAQLVHAEEFILKQEKGYDTQVGEGGGLLSTGQKQLLSFARVILADPRIFVLDEATSSIDTETEQLIQNAITKVLSGRTSFIVAHRLSTIRNADRILVIREGQITEQGNHKQLMKQKGYYYNLYTNQFREEARLKVLGEGGTNA